MRVVWTGFFLLLSVPSLAKTDLAKAATSTADVKTSTPTLRPRVASTQSDLTPEVLIRFEIARLLEWDKRNPNPVLEFPKQGAFKAPAALRAFLAKRNPAAAGKEIHLQDLLDYLASLEAEGKSLGAEEAGEWIAILRAQNGRMRGQGPNGDLGAELKKEVDNLAKAAGAGAGLSLPGPAKSALQSAVDALPSAEREALGPLNGDLTPKQLQAALNNPKVLSGLDEKAKADLLGAARMQAPEINPGFINDLKYDVGLDAYKRKPTPELFDHLEQLRALQNRGNEPAPKLNSTPSPTYKVPDLNKFELPKNAPQGGGSPEANRPQSPQSPMGSSGGGMSGGAGPGNAEPPEKLPPAKDLSVSELARLEKGQDQKKNVGQNFLVKFADGNVAGCQLTWIKEEKLPGTNFCRMAAATARHCSRGRGGVESIDIRAQEGEQAVYRLSPFNRETGEFKFINDSAMGDMGLLIVDGPCDLASAQKTVPLAATSASAEEPLWLEKKTNQILNARVMGAYSEDPSMTVVDFRVAANSGAGVIEGDSGGPVLKIEDGQPRLTGVISARFVARSRSQIGLITSGDALTVARSIMDQIFPPSNLVAHATPSLDTLATH